MQIVPLQPVPNQQVNVQLAGQNCTIAVYQTASALFLDLSVNNILIIGGVVGWNLNRIVRDIYLGFVGDLSFIDSEGTNDPDFTGLGARYNLAYLSTSDLAAVGLVG